MKGFWNLWIVGLICLLAPATKSDYVEMSEEFLEQVTSQLQQQLVKLVRQANESIKEHQKSWTIEAENADNWRSEIESLAQKSKQHEEALEKAKNDILQYSESQCIQTLKVRKLQCLDCVASSCSMHARENCDFGDLEEESILDKIINYLMEFFHVRSRIDEGVQRQSQFAIEQATKNLRETTNKLVYQLELANRALEKAGSKVNTDTLKKNMEEVTTSGKSYIKDISDRIKSSELVLDHLLEKDQQTKESLELEMREAEEMTGPSRRARRKSIFATIWHETTTFLKKVAKTVANAVKTTVCFVSFGKAWCPGKKNNQGSQEVSEDSVVRFDSEMLGSLPACAKLEKNLSLCLSFVPMCRSECTSLDMDSVCPRWHEEWMGYKRAWAISSANLGDVYSELQEAEQQMLAAIQKHNRAVAQVLKDYGWLADHATGSNRLEEIKVLSLQFDPASFDSQVVNKFTNSTIKVKMSEGETETVHMEDLIDPYNAKEVAEAAMAHIKEAETKKHFAQHEEMIKGFTN